MSVVGNTTTALGGLVTADSDVVDDERSTRSIIDAAAIACPSASDGSEAISLDGELAPVEDYVAFFFGSREFTTEGIVCDVEGDLLVGRNLQTAGKIKSLLFTELHMLKNVLFSE